MANQANASLGAYVPLILSANWWRRYLAGNRSWYLAAAAFVLGYLALFLIGVLMNVIGLRGFNWVTGFVVQVAVLIVAASWMHFVAVGGLGFIAGQPGGEAGLSAADGAAKGKEWLGKLGRFILHLGLNAPVAFYAIAIWPVGDAPFLAFIVLAASVSIALAVPLIFKDSQFWTKLLWFIHLMIVLLAVTFFTTKAVAPEQSRRLSTWIEARWSVNPADRARDDAAAKLRQARIDTAKACYDRLKLDADQTEKDRCEALYKAIDDPLLPKIAPILGERTTAADKAPAPAPAPAVNTAQAEPAWDCDTTWKQVEYAPSEHRGQMDLGTLPAGRYTIRVTGTVWQDFYTGTPSVFDKRCEANADGQMGDCRGSDNRFILNRSGATWPAPRPIPSAAGVHIPGEAYGKVLVHAWGVPLAIGEQGQIHTGEDLPITVDVNFYQHPASYAGPGKFRVTIKQCHPA